MIALDQFIALENHGKEIYYESVIRSHNKFEIPFWADILRTAIEKNSPIGLGLAIPELMDFYWDFKNNQIKKAI